MSRDWPSARTPLSGAEPASTRKANQTTPSQPISSSHPPQQQASHCVNWPAIARAFPKFFTMASPSSSPSSSAPSNPLRTAYLILYNAVSMSAWAVVLYRTIQTCLSPAGYPYVYFEVGEWTRWTQTAAILEILHSAVGKFLFFFHSSCAIKRPRGANLATSRLWLTTSPPSSVAGIVRAPIMTTVMQVASRLLLVWAITYPYPFITQAPFYASMLVAWSLTEVIRYSFFALNVAGFQPKILTWLRYNTFIILYPIGIFSECSLIMIVSKILQGMDKMVLWGILAVYAPGMSKSSATHIESRKLTTFLSRLVHSVHVHDQAEDEGSRLCSHYQAWSGKEEPISLRCSGKFEQEWRIQTNMLNVFTIVTNNTMLPLRHIMLGPFS